MTKRPSILPPRAQIPVAIALAAFFAALLWWRFAPDAKPSTRVSAAELTNTTYSLGEVQALIAEVQGEEADPQATAAPLIACERDPFLWDALAPAEQEAVEDAVDNTNAEQEALLAEREERAAQLRLDGTFLIGRSSVAIINGKHVKPGESIDGFVLNNVHERSAVLVDDFGAIELELAANEISAALQTSSPTTGPQS